jgi:hypothetical protein
MSKLEFYARPLVKFDAHNKEHRALYYQFVKKRSWGYSPYRFICPEDTGMDLITMIQRNLIDYYINREFDGIDPNKMDQYRQSRRSNYR